MIIWLLVSLGLAQGSMSPGARGPVRLDTPQTLEELLHDIDSSNRGARLYAAREIRRQARVASRGVHKPPRDELRAQELAVQYADLRREATAPAGRCLRHANVRRICAQILTYLPSPDAVQPLRSALDQEARSSVRKHLEAAIAAGEAT